MDRQRDQQVFNIPAPTSFSSSSMLFLILSYSSSIAWLPRIWDKILRALWVWPFWMSQRGLSGRNRNPKNCITAGTAERPSMYLEISKQRNKCLTFAYKNMLWEDSVDWGVCLLCKEMPVLKCLTILLKMSNYKQKHWKTVYFTSTALNTNSFRDSALNSSAIYNVRF